MGAAMSTTQLVRFVSVPFDVVACEAVDGRMMCSEV